MTPSGLGANGGTRRIDPRAVLLGHGVLCLAFLWVYLARQPGLPMFSNDTPSYLLFDPTRPVGYSAMLWLLLRIVDPSTIQVIQLVMIIASYGWLSYAAGRLVRSGSAGLIVLLVMLVYSGPIDSAATLVADAPSTALVAATAACLLFYLEAPRGRWMAMAILLAALAVAFRPVNLTLFPAIVLVALVRSGPRRRARALTAAMSLAALVVSWEASPIVHRLLYGHVVEGSPAARGLFGKSLFLNGPLTPEAAACDGRFIYDHTASGRAYLSQAHGRVRAFLEQRYSDYFRFSVVLPGLAAKHAVATPSQLDPILICYAKARIAADPGGFATIVLTNYWQLASNERFTDRTFETDLDAFVARHPVFTPEGFPLDRLTLEQMQTARQVLEIPYPVVRSDGRPEPFRLPPLGVKPPFERMLVAFCQLLALTVLPGVMILWLVRGPAGASPTSLALGAFSLIVHGQIAISALIEVGLARYMHPLWSIACVCTAIVGVSCLRLGWRRFAGSTASTPAQANLLP